MHHLAAWPRDGHRGRCYATSVLTCSPLLRSQRHGVVASKGEGERVFAVVSICVFALDLRGESASACNSRPICPVETSHPLTRDPNIDLQDMQTREQPANYRSRRLTGLFVVAIFHSTLQIAIHVPFGDGIFFVIEPLAAHQGDLDLGETVFQVHPQRHDCPAALSDLAA
jgi:hypothetical protein